MSKDDGIAFGKQFAPGLCLAVPGGLPSLSVCEDLWSTVVGNRANIWLDSAENTRWYIYFNKINWRSFYVSKGDVEPSNPTNPNDPLYDWSPIDQYLDNLSMINDPNVLAAMAISLNSEGNSAWPKFLDSEGLICSQGSTGNPRLVVNWARPALVQHFKNFMTAFAARYNNDSRFGWIRISEDNKCADETTSDWESGRADGVRFAHNVFTNKMIFLAQANQAWPLLSDVAVGAALADMKPFFGSCGSGGEPYDGTNPDCTAGDFYGNAQRHAGIVASPPGGIARATHIDDDPNGWRVQGSYGSPTGCWSPLGCLPNTSYDTDGPSATYNMDAHVYLWYGSTRQRNLSVSDVFGTNNIINWGVIPNMLPTIGSDRVSVANWRTALDIFAANGRKMVPALPYDWLTETTATATATATPIIKTPLPHPASLSIESDSPIIQHTLPVEVGEVTGVPANLFITPFRPSVSTTTADITPPTVPSISVTSINPTTITLIWTTSLDSESGVLGYNVYVDSSLYVMTPNTTHQLTGLAPDTEYVINVSAVDNAGNESALSDPVAVTTTVVSVTNDPPSVSATAISASKINIRWTQGAFSNYRVYRDNSSIGTTTHLVWTDLNVEAGTQYKYQVENFSDDGSTTGLSDAFYITSDTKGGAVTWAPLDDS